MGAKLANQNQQLVELPNQNDSEKLKDQVVQGLLQLVEEIGDFSFVGVHLQGDEERWAGVRGRIKACEASVILNFLPPTINQQQKVVIENTRTDSRFSAAFSLQGVSMVQFFIHYPLLSKSGRLLGSLYVLDTKSVKLSDKQLDTLELICRQLSYVLELQLLFKEQEKFHEEEQKVIMAKTGFLNMMGHELRTPLHGIIGMSSLLEQNQSPSEQMELMNSLKFSAESLLALINDMLDESKIKAGKMVLEQNDFCLDELLRKLSKSMGLMAQQKGIELQTRIHSPFPIVNGDALRLSQVLWNLLSNAIKFTEKGWVRLEVLPVMETEHLISLQFIVKDTGIGIPDHLHKEVFEEYSQALPQSKHSVKGTGLGLPISKKLLELMESEISVQSTAGEGSVFSFCLSLKKSANTSVFENTYASHPKEPEEEFISKKRVLLVDDNRVNQLVTGKMLEKWGMQISMARNGKEAISFAAEQEYDIILMDLQMPDMDGYTATREIRRLNDHNSKIPVMALTASGEPQLKEKLKGIGINNYLMKPFKPESLYNLIYKSLSNEEPKHPANPLQEKIDAIVNGDTDFKKQLLYLYNKSFREIMDDLQEGRLNDAAYLRSLRHKHKPSFKMLDLLSLESLLRELQHELDAKPANKKVLDDHLKAIHLQALQVIGHLEAIV